MLDRLRRSADLSTRIAAVAVLLALLATVVLGVAFRALGEPLIWSDELARYLMVWLAFIGWILASRRRSHIRITLVIERLPPPFRRILEALIQVALLVLGAFLVRDGFILVERNLDVETSEPAGLLGCRLRAHRLRRARDGAAGRRPDRRALRPGRRAGRPRRNGGKVL